MPAFNQNNIFHTTFKDKVNDTYRIYFHRGHPDEFTTPIFTKLPDGFIVKENINIKGSMPDDMPFGMQNANTMTLKVNLGKCIDTYLPLKNWIFLGNSNAIDSTNYTTLSNKQLSIPNRWTLCKVSNLDNDIVEKVIFDGVQDSKTSKKLTFVNGEPFFEFELIGIEKFVMTAENITDYFTVPNISTKNNKDIHYFYYESIYDPFWKVWNIYSNTKENRYYTDLNSLLATFLLRANTILRAVRRNYHYVNDLIFNNDFSHITFYKQQSNIGNSKGDSLSWSDIKVLFGITDENNFEFIGGAFRNESENAITQEYNTVWDFFKFFADSFVCKILWQYANPMNVLFQSKVYNQKYKSTNLDYKATRNINPSNLIKTDEFNFEYGKNVTNLATVLIKDIGKDDLEVNAKYLYGINENSYDIDLIMHNAIPQIETEKWNNDGHELKYNQIRARVRNLYYDDTTSIKAIHTSAILDLGDSITFDSTTNIDFDTMQVGDYTGITKLTSNSIVINKKNIRCLGYSITNAIVTQFGSFKDNVYLEIECKSSVLDISNIGDTYTIELNDIAEGLTLSPPLLTKAICVNAEYDVLNSTTKATLFIRGI